MRIFMNIYPILQKKLPDDEWKNLNIFKKSSSIDKCLYTPTNGIDTKLLEIYKEIFTKTYDELKINSDNNPLSCIMRKPILCAIFV